MQRQFFINDAVFCCCCFLLSVAHLMSIDATNYEIIGDEDRIFEGCNGEDIYGSAALGDLIELKNLQQIYDDNSGLVHTSGDIVVKVNLPPNVPIIMSIELLRWSRGQWTETPLSMKRTDLCKALRDPTEFWHSVVMEVPATQTDCPPKKGTIYKMENMTNHILLTNTHSSSIQGKFKAIVHFNMLNHSSCMACYFDVYQV